MYSQHDTLHALLLTCWGISCRASCHVWCSSHIQRTCGADKEEALFCCLNMLHPARLCTVTPHNIECGVCRKSRVLHTQSKAPYAPKALTEASADPIGSNSPAVTSVLTWDLSSVKAAEDSQNASLVAAAESSDTLQGLQPVIRDRFVHRLPCIFRLDELGVVSAHMCSPPTSSLPWQCAFCQVCLLGCVFAHCYLWQYCVRLAQSPCAAEHR